MVLFHLGVLPYGQHRAQPSNSLPPPPLLLPDSLPNTVPSTSHSVSLSSQEAAGLGWSQSSAPSIILIRESLAVLRSGEERRKRKEEEKMKISFGFKQNSVFLLHEITCKKRSAENDIMPQPFTTFVMHARWWRWWGVQR